MTIKLSDHFTYKKLIRFTLPSIAMMIFTSIYGVVDGFFVSNFVGKTQFAAVNFIMPLLMILSAFGFMFGTGGSALVSKTMGEGDEKKANSIFSMIVCISIFLSVIIAVFGVFLIRPIASALGADGEMLDYCVLYGRIILAGLPFLTVQQEFESFFVAAEKPRLGFVSTVIAGVTNMLLDGLFIAIFRWGVVGAASATVCSEIAGGLFPLIYFSRKNTSLLKFTKFKFDGRALLKSCTNGFSELMTSISMSVVGMLYNFQLIKYAGENGVAAYGVLMYVGMIFIAVFIGYSIGMAPVVGFHFGAQDDAELKSLLKKSMTFITVCSVGMFVFCELLAKPLSMLYVGYDEELLKLTLRGFSLFSFSFLFAGFSIFGSGFFTALNNGFVSAAISFLRTFVFDAAAILVLPILWETDGVWSAIIFSDLMAAIVTFLFLIGQRKKYRY